jgi:hypothetical protein
MPDARRNHPRAGAVLLAATAIAAALVFYFWLWAPPSADRPPVEPAGHSPIIPGINPGVPARGPDLAPELPPSAPSELAQGLNRPDGDIHSDLRTLDEIFRQYRSSTHRLNPVGENAEITAALTGRNPLNFAFIPANFPAINGQGELCDRWGTPFFFHSLSGTQMEIRSAGPDRKLWTADDEVITPGLRQPEL